MNLPKLNKDQVQKIFLSTLLMIALLYCYSTFLIGPLGTQQLRAEATLKELDTKIGSASTRTKRLNAMELQSKAAGETLAQVNALIPEGEPIAWFPPRMRAFFDRQGIHDIVIKLDRKEKPTEVDLASTFNNFQWTVELPSVPYIPLGIALAGLENEEQLLEIQRVQITSQPANPEQQRITLGIVSLLH